MSEILLPPHKPPANRLEVMHLAAVKSAWHNRSRRPKRRTARKLAAAFMARNRLTKNGGTR